MMADTGLAATAVRAGAVRTWWSRASGQGQRVAGARQALLLGGGAALGQGVAVLSAPLLTRLYDVASFGVFGSFGAAASCLACVATLRLDQAILLERDEDAAGDVLRLCVLSVGAVTLASALGAAALGAAGGVARVPGAVLALLPCAVASGGVVPALSLWFVRRERFGPVAAYGASRSGFAVALQGLGGWLGVPGAGLLVGGQVAGQALAAAGLARAGGAGLRAALCRGWSVARLRGALLRHRGFALYGAPQVLLRLLSTSLPAMLLPLFFGAAEAGLFWLAYRMLVLPQQVLTESLRPVFFRRAAALHAAGGDVRGAALRLAAGLGALCLPVAAVLVLAGPALFGAVFGPAWRGAGHDAAMIALAWCVETMQMPSAVLVSVLGRQRAYLGIEAASLLARTAALCAGAAWGGPDLAVGLYAAAWAATNAGVIAWMTWPPAGRARGAGA
ncbi:MAG: lipopolysaccharide biosynthesis protein [Janthinobacterium lividum]